MNTTPTIVGFVAMENHQRRRRGERPMSHPMPERVLTDDQVLRGLVESVTYFPESIWGRQRIEVAITKSFYRELQALARDKGWKVPE